MINYFIYFLWWCCILSVQLKSVIAEPILNNDALVLERHSLSSSEIKLQLADHHNVSKIYIYLTHTFFGDESLDLKGIKELHIFAETWNITQSLTFDLSGFDGEKQKAAINGSAGNTGNPGMDGGNFFGLANRTINGNYLTVRSNGGNGGYGQDGSSSDDVYVLMTEGEDNANSGWFSNGDLHNHYKKYFDDRGYISEVLDIDDYTSFYAVFVHDKKASFNIRLHPQTCCGTTGMGGLGGHGGRPGKFKFTFVNLSNSSYESGSIPTFLAKDGDVGGLGKDAKACEELALDVRIDTELKKVVFIVLPIHHSFSSQFTVLNHTKSTKCLPKYVHNNNKAIISMKQNEIDVASSVMRYKQFLIQNMKNFSVTSIAQTTYEAICYNSHLINEGNPLRELVLEASEFEKNYFLLIKSKIDVHSIYRRLLDRVNMINAHDLPKDDIRALSHLNDILEMKLRDMNRHNNIIANLKLYSEVAVSIINFRNGTVRAITNINDIELQNNLNQLQFEVNGNVMLDEYYYAIKGFQLTYFPFAANYLKQYSIPTSTMAYKDLEDITIATTDNLKTLSQSISELMSDNSEILIDLNHIDYTTPDDAFFVWKNSNVRNEVRKLFEGKKITLFADVKQRNESFNALKYKSIDIAFRSSNQTINKRLNKVLKSFLIAMNHTGVGETRCNRNFYQIITKPFFVQISFEKDQFGVPTTYTRNYGMMRDHPATLSPYTLWEIQIIEDRGHQPFRNISQLARFAQHDIDIELHGTGQYLEEDVSVCDTNNVNLPKFYSKL